MFLIYVFMGYCALLMFGQDIRSCAKSCPSTMKIQYGECVLCNGPCPKICNGSVTVHAGNIDSFKGCTIIEGYLNILNVSFRGYERYDINGYHYEPGMHPSKLEVFSTVKEITYYLNIRAEHQDFKSLSFFRNLKIIHTDAFYTNYSSLYIVKTSLISLELKSLKTVKRGRVVISDNKNLCFVNGMKWRGIVSNETILTNIARNGDRDYCTEHGLICDEQCDENGCWGIGPEQCISCKHYKFGNKCLQSCDVEPGLYGTKTHECLPCQEQCGACVGPGLGNCTTCKNFKDGSYCVEKCPTGKYYVENDMICKPCHSTCFDSCTGPTNIVGQGGCTSCELSMMNENATVVICLPPTNSCPDGYYIERVDLQVQEKSPLRNYSGKALCKKCHPRCKKCTGYGFHTHDCQVCNSFRKEEHCEEQCTLDYYPDMASKVCVDCDPECKGCTGPGSNSCVECQNIKLFDDGWIEPNNTFRCVSMCPREFPYKIFPENAEPYCSDKPGSVPLILVTYLVSIVGGILVVLILVGILVYWNRIKKIKNSAIKVAMAMDLKSISENDLLEPSNALPNTAHLRIIKDTEIQRGSTLGHGAFGVVYKGKWTIDGENELKIPIAIKVLRSDATTNNSKEFLSEAYIMASVDHPNLLKLLAVCMTSEMMLITQLMPLGCLLDFVRKNRDDIGSKTLLNWSAQIANGMAYLEKKRFVHRDLAARNVLVKSVSCVKITDFGLAKFLDVNEEIYNTKGGLMPIKWLALECIQYGIYTHKTDVWSFGVTVWELLTFGDAPYNKVSGWSVQKLLERGERLPQPIIATIDVYLILIKCWIFDADSRPGFVELEKEFSKMAKDPGRYLTVPGDRLMRLEGGLDTRVSNRDMIRYLASGNKKVSEAYDYIYQSQSKEYFNNTPLYGKTSASPSFDGYVTSFQTKISDGNYLEPRLRENENYERIVYS